MRMTRARTLNGLKDGEMRDAYQESERSRAFNLWAPEMHRIDGWYVRSELLCILQLILTAGTFTTPRDLKLAVKSKDRMC